MTANAIVTPNQTPPAGAERGINRANAPKISTSPVTIRNHWPIPIWSNICHYRISHPRE
jgi:hypothetical protein